MSVKIRLKRMGSKKKPFYRFVAADSRNARDGRFIETLGYYNPMTNPPDLKIDEEAVSKWLKRGALPSPNTESLFRRIGFMQRWQLLKQGVKPEEQAQAKTAEAAADQANEGEAR
ncbi:MAG: 30S ribosomal protein S16 [Chitinivibrionia bacterium]|nr:30S ribosomal protein S16 [Chitinivibrionia bacterium]